MWRYSIAESSRHVEDSVRRKARSSSEQSSSGSDSEWESAPKRFTDYRKALSNKSIEKFQETFETKINPFEPDKMIPYQRDIMESVDIEKGFTVMSYDQAGKGLYDNIINVEVGEIIGINNYKNNTENWHLSHVIYNQIILVMKEVGKNILGFDLNSWYDHSIDNEDTKNVALKWLHGSREESFEEGSEAFNELINTQTGKSKKYLTDQNPEDFPGKRVTSIRVILRSNKKIDIDYRYGS